MASEYLKKKYRDVRPEAKRELTPKEKRKNWWHYYKWHVVIGAGLLAILGSMVWSAQHRVEPDYQVAYVGADPQAAMAAGVKLMADLTACESYFFLLEDPEGFQRRYGSLCRLDGSLPAEGDPAGGTYLAWAQCPVLAQIDLGEYSYPLMGETVEGSGSELVSGLYLARRGFWTEKSVPYPEGCETLWNKLTEGAAS